MLNVQESEMVLMFAKELEYLRSRSKIPVKDYILLGNHCNEAFYDRVIFRQLQGKMKNHESQFTPYII